MNEQTQQSREQSDLLQQLITLQKKELRNARLTALACVVLIAAALFTVGTLVPRAISLIGHLESSLTELDTLATNASEMMAETGNTIREVDGLVRNANRVVVDNTETVTEAVGKLNSIDFEGLNTAIDGLATAVEPLAKLGGLFH